MPDTPLSRIAAALDTHDWAQFEAWCRLFGPRVGLLKVGLEAFTMWGPAAVASARETGAEVFLDLKLHDIPHTVAAATAVAREHGVRFLTVHAAGGRPMLEAAVEAAGSAVGILAVTVLTHLDPPALEELGETTAIADRVASWALLARDAGCQGIVCSPRELRRLRALLARPFQLVTPGIRPAGAARDDQRRTATPAEALAEGADYIVIGRPLTRAPEPGEALAALRRELAEPAL